jgi:hypothetical protein
MPRFFIATKSEQAVDVAVFIDVDIVGGRHFRQPDIFMSDTPKVSDKTRCHACVRLLDGTA